MLMDWFNTAPVTSFGVGLAQYYAREIVLISEMRAHKRNEKQAKLIANVLAQVKTFCASNKLNIYKKAKLGNSIKWTLKDLGFDEAHIEALLKEVLFVMK